MTSGITDDPNDPGIKRGPPDETPVPMHDAYVVLSAEERAKGFVRPVRRSYRHVGIAGPSHPLRDLTEEDRQRWGADLYVKYEQYPPDTHGAADHRMSRTVLGKLWTKAQLDSVGKGCGTVTTMGTELAETYARNPGFYGATYCCGCSMHREVGAAGEFVWEGTNERVGT